MQWITREMFLLVVLLTGCADQAVTGEDEYWWVDDPRYAEIDPTDIDAERTLALGDQREILVLRPKTYEGEEVIEMVEEDYGANQAHNFVEHPEAFDAYMVERMAILNRGDRVALDSLDATNVTEQCPCHVACEFEPCEYECDGGDLPGANDPPGES